LESNGFDIAESEGLQNKLSVVVEDGLESLDVAVNTAFAALKSDHQLGQDVSLVLEQSQ
jgi:hypothetical protein